MCVLRLVLWSWLPLSLHPKNPRLIFSTAENGYRLETLFNKCEGQPHYMIIKAIAPGIALFALPLSITCFLEEMLMIKNIRWTASG